MKTCVITGGTGFIGSNLAKRLLELGWTVYITGQNDEQQLKCFRLCYNFSRIRWFNLRDVDVLFHQAAITDTTVYDEQLMLHTNVWNSMNMFQDAYKYGVRQIVYASSCAVYGDVAPPFVEDGPKNPLNIYGKSKWLLDQEAMQWGKANNVNIVGLRYSNVYGSGEDHKKKNACLVTQIGNTMRQKKRPRLFKWGEQTRDFVYVKDVVEYNIAAASFQGQAVFNGGSGTATPIIDVVKAYNQLFKSDLDPEYIDNPYVGKYQSHTCCDMSKTATDLGVIPQWKLFDAIADYSPVVRDVATIATS